MVLPAILDHPGLLAVAPTGPGIVTLIINISKFLVPLLTLQVSQTLCIFCMHSFTFDAPKIWNDLPNDVHSATSMASLRKKLQTYLFAKAYLFVAFMTPVSSWYDLAMLLDL